MILDAKLALIENFVDAKYKRTLGFLCSNEKHRSSSEAKICMLWFKEVSEICVGFKLSYNFSYMHRSFLLKRQQTFSVIRGLLTILEQFFKPVIRRSTAVIKNTFPAVAPVPFCVYSIVEGECSTRIWLQIG